MVASRIARARQLSHVVDELAEQLPRPADVAPLRDKGGARVRRVERKLERAARRLPIDTPLDRQRRRRVRRRGLLIAVAAIAAGAVLAFVIARSRRGPDQAQGPDAWTPDDAVDPLESHSSASRG